MATKIADQYAEIAARMRTLGLSKDAPITSLPDDNDPLLALAADGHSFIHCQKCGVNIKQKEGHQQWRYACTPCFNDATINQREAWLDRVEKASGRQ